MIDDLIDALGPAPSPAVARLRWSGLVAWDTTEMPERHRAQGLPEKYRALIHKDSTWVASASMGQVAKNPDLMKHLLDFDPNATFVDVPGFTNDKGHVYAGMRLFFDVPKESP